MAKKQWISVKCGLSRDPKHRQAMGESVWLFLHMIDRADWESGKVLEWKDEAEAEDMGMPVRTLREHRRKLEELDYISCAQKQYGQEITIHNWTNPREYSGVVTNKKQGGKEPSPSSVVQGDTQGYIQGSRKDVTPTSNSKNQTSTTLSPEETAKANKLVDAILASGAPHWQGREIFQPDHLPLVDWYHEATGQECRKSVRNSWMRAVGDWAANNLTAADLQAAYDADIKWRGVFINPMQLTEKAIALKAQKKANPKEVEYYKEL